ncbi:SDR family NAD(P)-dependent oxidoreductase [Armatimonas sp.]|uniref:SDR family NAD(P)-dependent oxidoreductase n=1 Tax=Armatimonas sp. TaxID=1872638 RepID=UPI003751C16C
MFRLDGKRALVTGGASGIGAAIAETLKAQGARVLVLDLNDHADLPCDVSDPDSVARAFAKADEHGPLDLLVCSAGIGFVGDILKTTPADFDRLMGVNARGLFLCCQEAVRRMKASGKGGSIVNICSIAAETALAERFAYAATKGAVLAMTRCIAKDFVNDKIRCNAVCPARVHTPFVDAYLTKNYPGKEAEQLAVLSAAQPMGRMGQPAEIAALVAYLCSDEANFVTGAAYDIDGGVMAMH